MKKINTAHMILFTEDTSQYYCLGLHVNSRCDTICKQLLSKAFLNKEYVYILASVCVCLCVCEGERGEHSNNQNGAVIRFGSLHSLLNLSSVQCNRGRAKLHLYETRGTHWRHTYMHTHTIKDQRE